MTWQLFLIVLCGIAVSGSSHKKKKRVSSITKNRARQLKLAAILARSGKAPEDDTVDLSCRPVLTNKICGTSAQVSALLDWTKKPLECAKLVARNCENKDYFTWRETNGACHCVRAPDCSYSMPNIGLNVYKINHCLDSFELSLINAPVETAFAETQEDVLIGTMSASSSKDPASAHVWRSWEEATVPQGVICGDYVSPSDLGAGSDCLSPQECAEMCNTMALSSMSEFACQAWGTIEKDQCDICRLYKEDTPCGKQTDAFYTQSTPQAFPFVAYGGCSEDAEELAFDVGTYDYLAFATDWIESFRVAPGYKVTFHASEVQAGASWGPLFGGYQQTWPCRDKDMSYSALDKEVVKSAALVDFHSVDGKLNIRSFSVAEMERCSPGSSGVNGLEPCVGCGPGTYQDKSAQSECLICPLGKITPQDEAVLNTFCEACPQGKSSWRVANECTGGSSLNEFQACEKSNQMMSDGTCNSGIIQRPIATVQKSDADVSLVSGSFQVEVFGNSGTDMKLAFAPTGEVAKEANIKLDRLEEVNSHGFKVQGVENWSNLNFTWTSGPACGHNDDSTGVLSCIRDSVLVGTGQSAEYAQFAFRAKFVNKTHYRPIIAQGTKWERPCSDRICDHSGECEARGLACASVSDNECGSECVQPWAQMDGERTGSCFTCTGQDGELVSPSTDSSCPRGFVATRPSWECIKIPVHSVKFGVTVSKWPWQSTANRLRLGAKLTDDSGLTANAHRSDLAATNGDSLVSLGNGFNLVNSEYCTLDGVRTPVDDITLVVNQMNWVFPYFAHELVYDPVLNDGTCSDGTMNNDETGVDTGGSCAFPCSALGYIGSIEQGDCECAEGFTTCVWNSTVQAWTTPVVHECSVAGYIGSASAFNCTCDSGYSGCGWDSANSVWLTPGELDECIGAPCNGPTAVCLDASIPSSGYACLCGSGYGIDSSNHTCEECSGSLFSEGLDETACALHDTCLLGEGLIVQGGSDHASCQTCASPTYSASETYDVCFDETAHPETAAIQWLSASAVSCELGYSGSPTYNSGGQYDSGCNAVACPANSSGTSVGDGCTCNVGWEGSIAATATSPFWSGACVAITCDVNHYVSNNVCIECAPGYIRSETDDATGPDTTCDVVLCDEDYYVSANMCLPCAPGSTNVADDDASNGDTVCDPVLCGADQHVVNNICTDCASGFDNTAGDDASGEDTTCDDIDECASNPCVLEGHVCQDTGVFNYTCVCPYGWTGAVCDTPVTACVEQDVCQNGGTCAQVTDIDVIHLCHCVPGFIGDTCQHDVYGSLQDDPHIVGFDGSRFDFQGHPGSVFNLMSDYSVQVNSLFVESPVDTKTYMGELAVMVPNNAIWTDLNGNVTLNKVPLHHESATGRVQLRTREGQPTGFVEWDLNQKTVFVSTRGLDIKMFVVQWHANHHHLNFQASIRPQFLSAPHGILGQTAQCLVDGERPTPKHGDWKNPNAVGIIEGDPEDYLVADGIFGRRFTYNRFANKVYDNLPNHADPAQGSINGGADYALPANTADSPHELRPQYPPIKHMHPEINSKLLDVPWETLIHDL